MVGFLRTFILDFLNEFDRVRFLWCFDIEISNCFVQQCFIIKKLSSSQDKEEKAIVGRSGTQKLKACN